MFQLNVTLPANVENYTISANLNASMLYCFLMGIYTIVYGGTLYVCLTKTTPNTSNRVVLPTITILYLFALVYFILVWYILNWTYVLHGDTKASIFVASYAPPGWFNIADELLQGLPIVIADALLIWRCYHVWGKSWKAISFPSFFLVSELILGISDVILESQVPLYSMAGSSTLARKIKTALAFTSVITTSSSTFLIGYKIRTVSNGIGQSSTRYIRIFTIILESSAIYSVVLLMFALTFLPVFDSDNLESPLSQAGIYVASLLNIISGLPPTIMVLLIALSTSNSKTSTAIKTNVSTMNFSTPSKVTGKMESTVIMTRDEHIHVTSLRHMESYDREDDPVLDIAPQYIPVEAD